MKQTIPLGRIAGIRIGANWSVLVIVALLAQGMAATLLPRTAPGHGAATYWGVAAGTAVLFVASLLAHELAHALVARWYGIRVHRVTLWALGGVAELEDQPPHPRADLLVALAGPLTSLGVAMLVGAAALLAGLPAVLTAALWWVAVMNAVVAVFNLLPGAPLDGGRVLRAVLWWRSGNRVRADLAAARAGRVLGIVLIVLGALEVLGTGSFGGLWLALIGWFLIAAATAEQTGTTLHQALAGLRAADIMTPAPVCGYAGQTVSAFVDSVAATTPHLVFPVCDDAGRPVGTVNLTDLARLPAPARQTTRLGEMAVRVPVVEPDVPAADVAVVAARSPVLVAHDRLLGIITPTDLARTTALARLSGTGTAAGRG